MKNDSHVKSIVNNYLVRQLDSSYVEIMEWCHQNKLNVFMVSWGVIYAVWQSKAEALPWITFQNQNKFLGNPSSDSIVHWMTTCLFCTALNDTVGQPTLISQSSSEFPFVATNLATLAYLSN